MNVICVECDKDLSNTHNLKVHMMDVHGKELEITPNSVLADNKRNVFILTVVNTTIKIHFITFFFEK